MEAPVWILDEVVLAIHQRQLAEHGGTEGIRDRGLLDSALAKPKNIYNYDAAASLSTLAAAYASGIIRNHPFVDGNKRTALVVTLLFLDLNHYKLSAAFEERYKIFYALAEGSITEAELTEWFERHGC